MTHEKIVDRIRKLLALGRDGGATEHEAARAMELATKLMLEHGIAESAINKPGVELGGDADVDHKWEMYCAHAACALYGTKPIIYAGSRLKFVGRADNIAATEMTYEWLRDQIELFYKAALPSGMSKAARADYRRSFKSAAAGRVYTRAVEIVRQLKDKGTPQSTALVVLDYRKQLEIEADDFIQTLGARKGHSRGLTLKNNRGTSDGFAAGDKIRLQQEVK
jgi:Protein of unknown function (DUF2786)